jgi:hypothetical protein
MVTTLVRSRRISDIHKVRYSLHVQEAMAYCPRCQALQTVWINGDTLMPTRKFYQTGARIYHDCGSSQPCHLYRNG